MPDGWAFDEFVRNSLPALNRYAYSLTGDRAEAEDLLQDTLLKVSRAWRRIRADGNPLAYARTAMLRTYLSAWRSLLHRPRQVPLDHDLPRAAADPYGHVDARDQLRRGLAELSPGQRAVLVLGYLDDLSDEQIAAVLNRRPATVRSLRLRGLHALRRHLVGPGAAPDDTPNPQRLQTRTRP
jgi:RNA polymerase sigma-70 factor (sigma-E family)